jgi:hypothetical protein
MTVDDINHYLSVLEDNNKGINNSFVYFLDQENAFHEQAFWQLYNSIVGLTQKPQSDVVDRACARTLCRIQAHILSGIVQHFLPDEVNDSQIRDIPVDAIEAYIERLEYAVDGYFTGSVVDEKRLEHVDGLRNPGVDEE